MNKYVKKRLLTLFIASIPILIGVIMVLNNLSESIMFFMKPSEIKEKYQDLTGKVIRVGGVVMPGVKSKITSGIVHTQFYLTDCKSSIKVKYHGVLPNLFREKQGIIAKGKITNDGKTFEATELITKHDEYYSAKKPENTQNNLCNFK